MEVRWHIKSEIYLKKKPRKNLSNKWENLGNCFKTLFLHCFSDDGKLSFDEFNAYFADGILTTEELQELFYSIDGRQNT